MYTLINGSQKNGGSNSEYFLNYISDYLDDFIICSLKNDSLNGVVSNINFSDTIILAFPLYVDSPNSLMLSFLDYIYDNKIDISNKKIYVIINCGFREGEHNITALNIIKSWCLKLNSDYQGSILIGAGEIVGKKHYRFISKKALSKLKDFGCSICKKEKTEDYITTMDIINNKTYCFLANRSWNKKGKRNKLNKKDIKKHDIKSCHIPNGAE